MLIRPWHRSDRWPCLATPAVAGRLPPLRARPPAALRERWHPLGQRGATFDQYPYDLNLVASGGFGQCMAQLKFGVSGASDLRHERLYDI